MNDWRWPDPFQLLPVGRLPIPTDYRFLFEPIPSIGIVVGIFYFLSLRTNSSKLLVSLFLFLILSMAGANEFAEKYVLVWDSGPLCPRAGTENYIAVSPLFAPEEVQMFMPGNGHFDATQCDEFVEITMRKAAPGRFATLAILAALLAVSSFCLGAIFSWPFKVLRGTESPKAG